MAANGGCSGCACSGGSGVGSGTSDSKVGAAVSVPVVWKPGEVIHVESIDDYFSVLEAAAKDGDRLVVVDCYAPWCPPCREIAPVFEGLASDYTNVVFIKINMDKASPALSKELSIWAMPTFVFLKNSQKVGSFMGANQNLLRKGLDNNGQVSICSSLACNIQ